MKAVMLSIQPKYCELIASGKKTVEVRRTKPKIDVPFKCYIYMTKAYDTLFGYGKPKKLNVGGGYVIGEFVCDNIYDIAPTSPNKYDCSWNVYEEHSRLTFDEFRNYLGEKNGYGWHISDLVIYDEPRELREFRSYNVSTYIDEECGLPMPTHEIKRPFQSWGYVYEVDT